MKALDYGCSLPNVGLLDSRTEVPNDDKNAVHTFGYKQVGTWCKSWNPVTERHGSTTKRLHRFMPAMGVFQAFSTHSYDNKPYYFPSLEAGRLFTKTDDSGKPLLMMPLSITCHHAATDGWNVSRFLKRLQHDANGFEAFV